MLRVGHIPLSDTHEGPVPVTAHIHAHSGATVDLAQVVYRHGGGDWQVLPLASAGPDTFRATIPPPAQETVCEYYLEAADGSGRTASMPRVAPATWYEFVHGPSGLSAAGEGPPAEVVLHPNYPNPFNPRTSFSFDLHHPGHVSLVVIDVRGHLVRTLVDEVRSGGSHTVNWDGRDDQGRTLAAGIYLYRLQAAGLQYTRAATLVK
jgi:hypothetical protein